MVIQGRTRESLRISVGYNVSGQEFYVSSTTSGVDASSVIDTTRKSGSGADKGRWVIATSGDNDGTFRKVTADNGAGDLSVDAFGATVPTGMSYELWEEKYPPSLIHQLMQDAATDATGRAFDPIESVALWFDGKTSRHDIPSGISMIQSISYREAPSPKIIHEFGRKFDETTTLVSAANQTVDSEDFRRGLASLKLDVQVGASAGEIITDSIASLDLSGMTHIEGWIKASVAVASGDYVIRLDNGTVQGDATDLEVLAVPATVGLLDWTPFRIALANPQSDAAVVSVGIEMNVDLGAHIVWFDQLQAVNEDRSKWNPIPRHLWSVDKESRDLVLKQAAVNMGGYGPLKIIGGDKPALMSADSDTTELDDMYIIAYATAHAMAAADDPRAKFWFARLEQAKGALPILENVRRVV